MNIFMSVATLVLVTTALCSCGNDAAPQSTTASGVIDYYQIDHPATMSSPWGDGSSSHRPAEAVRFTPASYPFTIRSVTVYAKNNTGYPQSFNLYGYSDLEQESDLFAPVLNQTLPDTGSSYIAKTVSVPETTVSAGNFYIAVEWVAKPLSSESGANSFYILTDGQLDYPQANFIRFGNTWTSLASMTNVTAGDLGIVVNH